MNPQLTYSQRQWLHSSVGRASHRYREVTGSNPVEALNFFSGFFTQLHKLPSLRRSFLHFQKSLSQQTVVLQKWQKKIDMCNFPLHDCTQEQNPGGTSIRNRRGCSSEILNLTPKGDHLGVAQAFCDL